MISLVQLFYISIFICHVIFVILFVILSDMVLFGILLVNRISSCLHVLLVVGLRVILVVNVQIITVGFVNDVVCACHADVRQVVARHASC